MSGVVTWTSRPLSNEVLYRVTAGTVEHCARQLTESEIILVNSGSGPPRHRG